MLKTIPVAALLMVILLREASAESISSQFQVQKLTIRNHKDQRGAWVERSTVVSKQQFYVIVGASWCHYTLALLRAMATTNKALASKIDLILLYDDEIPTVVSIEKREDGEAKASEIERKLRTLGRKLIDPDAVNLKLPLYMVKETSVAKLVGGFPSILKCDEMRCKSAHDEILDDINPILLEESKRSE